MPSFIASSVGNFAKTIGIILCIMISYYVISINTGDECINAKDDCSLLGKLVKEVCKFRENIWIVMVKTICKARQDILEVMISSLLLIIALLKYLLIVPFLLANYLVTSLKWFLGGVKEDQYLDPTLLIQESAEVDLDEVNSDKEMLVMVTKAVLLLILAGLVMMFLKKCLGKNKKGGETILQINNNGDWEYTLFFL